MRTIAVLLWMRHGDVVVCVVGTELDLSAGKDSPLQVALRLARYSCAHAAAMQALLVRLSTIPETMELARATGLTAGQALYNAQMIRTHSLLLRTAQRTGFIMGGRQVCGLLLNRTVPVINVPCWHLSPKVALRSCVQ